MSERTRVDRLIEEVLACAPEDREAFLDAACADNVALREEIASLLEQASRAHSFLEQPAAVPSLIGRMLGPYRIDAAIGAGGMGEVYRARDTKLGRDVAIKILPAFMAQDPDLLARLGREARTLAALNHPNIGSIYGLEEADGVRGLVLELIDGDTLADRIARGPLPIVEAIRIAGQIAGALAAAHAKDIVHRDLKPANIKITSGGSVKVLDFGLAKTGVEESESTTLATRAGSVMGTPAYMSPEQARGETVDQQTDIWAFGCVLYEMLTARRAFGGGTASDCIAAILTAEPDWVPLPAATPASLRTLLARCLAKDRSQRLHSIADAQFDLGVIAESPTLTSPGVLGRSRWHWLLPASVSLTVGLAGYLYTRSGDTPASLVTYNVQLDLPDGFKPWAGLAFSPDGKAIVASVAKNIGADGVHLIVQYLDQLNGWQQLKESDAGESPFWSPDGKHIAFFVKDKLLRVESPNGAPFVVCDVNRGRGGVWLEDGTIVFGAISGPLMRVSAGGGTPTEFVPLESGFQSLRYPATAGAGRLLYLAQHLDDSRSELRSINLNEPQRSTTVVRTPKHGVYAHGYLFYERNGIMIRQRFNPSTNQREGEPVPIVSEGGPSGHRGYLPLAAGVHHLALAMIPQPLSQLVWVDRSGRSLDNIGEPNDYSALDLSPAGKHVAITHRSGQNDNIWVVDTASGVSRSVTSGPSDFTSIWAADGQRVAYISKTGSIFKLMGQSVDGPPNPTVLAERDDALSPVGWTPDGRFVWLIPGSTTDTDLGQLGIFMEQRAGSGDPVPFRAGLRVSSARLSPDGAHIAFVSGKSGRSEVYVDTFPTHAAEPRPISNKGGLAPRWARNGRELYFVAGSDLMVVAVSPGATPRFGEPARLFRLPSSQYGASPDGSKFVVLEPRTSPTSSLKVTLNWFASVSARN